MRGLHRTATARTTRNAPTHSRTLVHVFEAPGGRQLDRVPTRDAAHNAPAGARTHERMVTTEFPIRVQVWLTTPRGEYHADGEAVAWTTTQVRVHYLDAHGREGWAWVWAPAVTRAGT